MTRSILAQVASDEAEPLALGVEGAGRPKILMTGKVIVLDHVGRLDAIRELPGFSSEPNGRVTHQLSFPVEDDVLEVVQDTFGWAAVGVAEHVGRVGRTIACQTPAPFRPDEQIVVVAIWRHDRVDRAVVRQHLGVNGVRSVNIQPGRLVRRDAHRRRLGLGRLGRRREADIGYRRYRSGRCFGGGWGHR
ncbi:MAG TPA: hypothetical protein VGE30_01030 [Candidatus Saccharimonadales bacterium]